MAVYIKEIDTKIWMDVDIDTIIVLSATNKYIYDVLHTDKFWMERYKHDNYFHFIKNNIPIYFGDWVKDYKLIIYSINMANKYRLAKINYR
jgi:Tol biopolymer transport system component